MRNAASLATALLISALPTAVAHAQGTAAAGGSIPATPAASPAPEVAATAAAAADDSARWAGTSLTLSHFAQIAPTIGLEPDWNPTIGQILAFDPRWQYS